MSKELDINELESGRAHLIEANAGTGKTYAIANLFLRFVLEGKRVRELLVVTFTRAATDELRGRIRARLAEAHRMLASGEADENADDFFAGLPAAYPKGDKRKQAMQNLELALFETSEAPIHTIHGFCQQTLGDKAFSSGQLFELEQADDDNLKRRAMQDWWRKRTYALEGIERSVFQCVIPDFNTLEKKLGALLGSSLMELYPKVPTGINSLQKTMQKALAALADSWEKEREGIRELLLDNDYPLNRKSHSIKKLEERLDDLNQHLLTDPPTIPNDELLGAVSLSRFKFKGAATDEDEQRLNEHASFKHAEELLKSMKEASEKLLVHELDKAQKFVRNRLTATKRQLGQLSFDDMIKRLHERLVSEESAAEALAKDLAGDYPVIMVDEFQDTDPLQYAIFERIHRAGRGGGHTLILIGDPKQAIYAFRGGDIFTYMQARREADRHWNLSVNWRSTTEMIDVVNMLFSGNNPFTYTDIPYHSSQFPAKKNDKSSHLIIDAERQTALRVEDLPANSNKDAVEKWVHDSVAGRIAELLQPGKARLDAEALKPSDIAILVVSHQQGKAVREALLKHGIRAVAAGKDSIWGTPEAQGLQRLLEAALLPTDRQLLRQALAQDMLNLGYHEIHEISIDTRRWGHWADLLAETGIRWREHGFMAGFQHLLHGLSEVITPSGDNPAGWLARVPDPERTLTNLLHLADLLQSASRERASGEHLLAWMKRQKNIRSGDDLEPRLESDEKLVRIVTIHKSKGLQYPVVFVPYLWGGKENPKKNSPLSWHEETDTGYRHLYSPNKCDEGLIPAAHERLGEDLRLAYVALTRVESHCHLYFGSAGRNIGRTALAWLLSGQDINLDKEEFSIRADSISPNALEGKRNIEVTESRAYDEMLQASPPDSHGDELGTRSFKRAVRRNWSVGSFSAMTRDVHQTTRAPAVSGTEHFALRYPAGAHVGNFLHALLERLDPNQELRPQIERLAPWLFERHDIKKDDVSRDLDGLANWMQDVLNTPIDATDLTLAGLNRQRVQCELDFDLGTGPVNAERVDALLQGLHQRDLPPLAFREFQGMLTGTIDLVFEHEGQYYIADYKSNLLGRQLEDYVPKRLGEEIINRRYDLQYLLYTLALHRHLHQRIPDYDYERDFGGVYYLFLRAMQPEHGPRYGVHFTRPGVETIDQLDHALIGYPCKETA